VFQQTFSFEILFTAGDSAVLDVPSYGYFWLRVPDPQTANMLDFILTWKTVPVITSARFVLPYPNP